MSHSSHSFPFHFVSHSFVSFSFYSSVQHKCSYICTYIHVLVGNLISLNSFSPLKNISAGHPTAKPLGKYNSAIVSSCIYKSVWMYLNPFSFLVVMFALNVFVVNPFWKLTSTSTTASSILHLFLVRPTKSLSCGRMNT